MRSELTVIKLGVTGPRVLHWNGKDIPAELRELPAGTYVVEAVDEAPSLTSEEQHGIAQALSSLRTNKARTADQVRQTIDSIVRK
jgi:hypothetical protein